jgi:purine-cytosine permease-like protein
MIGYIGPGAGLELVGFFTSLIGYLIMAFSAILLYPFYALMRFFRGSKAATNPELVSPAETPTPASTLMPGPVPEKSLAITQRNP